MGCKAPKASPIKIEKTPTLKGVFSLIINFLFFFFLKKK